MAAQNPERPKTPTAPEEVVEAELAGQARPDVILVTSGMTYWYPGVADIIQRLRARWPGVPIALGGTYATLCPYHARTHSGADLVAPGASEVDALRIVSQLTGFSPARGGNPSPAGLPMPAHDLCSAGGYVAIRTWRGCPYQCPYCASDKLSPHGFVQQPPERVVAEIGWCYRELGVRDFAFYDENLELVWSSDPGALVHVAEDDRRHALEFDEASETTVEQGDALSGLLGPADLGIYIVHRTFLKPRKYIYIFQLIILRNQRTKSYKPVSLLYSFLDNKFKEFFPNLLISKIKSRTVPQMQILAPMSLNIL